MDELKLCPVPWCERVNKPEFYNPEPKAYCVACPDCGLETNVFATEAEAIAAWNTRAEASSAEPGDADKFRAALAKRRRRTRKRRKNLAVVSCPDEADEHLAEAFAAHRIAADLAGYERGQRETVARIVAWLRGQAIAIERLHDEATMDEQRKPLKIMAKARVVCADAIEAGEWK